MNTKSIRNNLICINNTIDDSYRTLDEVEEILMRWLYFVDDDLVDESGFSYFYDNLNVSMYILLNLINIIKDSSKC